MGGSSETSAQLRNLGLNSGFGSRGVQRHLVSETTLGFPFVFGQPTYTSKGAVPDVPFEMTLDGEEA